VRGGDGALLFTFDAGPSDVPGPTGKPPAGGGATHSLVVLPSATLAAIEQLGERAGEGATYTVSGEVTTYHDRAYLLIRSYKANRTNDQIMPSQ
jgi:hypothetical protein